MPAGKRFDSILIFTLIVLVMISVSVLNARHPNINLFDKNFDMIDPINGENPNAPFSTRVTCGLCHDYDAITEGYHFQQGWDVISDTFGVADDQPWVLSDGRMGGFCLTSFRQFAKKHNDTEADIDLPVYKFIASASYNPGDPTCGACHPGGGGMEFDREGNRYDEHLADNPELKESLDGDYHQSNWDQSGVVEADCFLCHMHGYNFAARVEQLQNENFQWATVAGSNLGIVDGYVTYGDTPVVNYNKRYFNTDGTISIDVSVSPDENCVFCHGASGVKKRGFSCNDAVNPDIHSEQGMTCTDCHPADISHNFARGPHAHTATDPEDSANLMLGCRECHMEGYLGATVPHHTEVRPSHLKRISCEACHIPKLGRAAAMGFDLSSGEITVITNPPDADGVGSPSSWKPTYVRQKNQVIYPMNIIHTAYWGNIDSDGILYPLFMSEHETAWELYSEQIEDDNDDGEAEVNTEEEIIAGLKAFKQSLADNPRFNQVNPAYIKGGKAYTLGENDLLMTLEREVESQTEYPISHNVAPARMTLGSNNCLECHGYDAHFFKGQKVVDMYNTEGEVVTQSIGIGLGCNPTVFHINTFHQQILSPLVSFMIILVVFLITLHYHRYGPKRIRFVYGSGEVRRFSFLERGVHLFRLISFILLAFTGLVLAFNLTIWQEMFFKSPQQMLDYHIWAGVVFIVTTILGIAIWFKDAIFASYDKIWVRLIGGYLGYSGEVPAGRFNAGQKMFFWYTAIFGLIMSVSGVILVFKDAFQLSTICLVSTVHNFVGFILIAGVLSHAYLGTIANPGTWRVLIDGFVTREWARHHHPIWYEKITGKPAKKSAEKKSENDKSDDSEEKK